MTARAVLALALCACGTPQHRAPRAVARPAYSAAQLAHVVDLGRNLIAPDGTWVAFTTDASGAYELDTVRIDGTSHRARTRAHEHVGGLAFSADARSLVFEMDHGGDERTDLWIIHGDAEPEALTHSATAEHGARFSPDGTKLAFESDPDRPFRFNVHVMDLATHAIRQLTHEPINVQRVRWTADGHTLVATRSGDDQRGDLLVIDAATGVFRAIASPRRDGILYAVDFFADGTLLALGTNETGFTQLVVVDIEHGTSRFVGPGDWDVEQAELAADGTVVFTRNVHGESEVSATRAPDFAPVRVLAQGGLVSDLSMDRAGHSAVIVREDSNHPSELLRVDVASATTTPLVPAEVAGIDVTQLARAERRTLTNEGHAIDYFVWKPAVTRLGTPPPLVMHVHGGPNGQTRGAFSPTVQALVEAGFVVASTNYRGSTGYGRAFEDSNNHDWGGGDLRDVLAAVNALAATGEIDRRRVGIYGGSYGGYMTLRAITAAPEVWRAAVDMFGMPDLVEDYRLTADRFGSWYETEMGDPVRDAALYRDRSPIHALDRVRAPLLVQQGANDENVPRAESDAVVRALEARHQPVEYVVYPDEGHGFTRREHRIDSMTRIVDFFRRHLGP